MPSKPAFALFIGFSNKNLKIGRFVGVGIIIARVLQKTVLKSDLNCRNKLEKNKSMLLSQNPSLYCQSYIIKMFMRVTALFQCASLVRTHALLPAHNFIIIRQSDSTQQ